MNNSIKEQRSVAKLLHFHPIIKIPSSKVTSSNLPAIIINHFPHISWNYSINIRFIEYLNYYGVHLTIDHLLQQFSLISPPEVGQ